MAPVYQITPRKDGKTQAEADEAMAEHVNTYYVQEEERGERDVESSAPPPAPAKRKAKRPAQEAQKQSTSTEKMKSDPKSDEVQSSPATRKSARVAAKKRAATDSTVSDEDEPKQPPMKRQKMTPAEEAMAEQVLDSIKIAPGKTLRQLIGFHAGKRNASESTVSDEDGEKQPPSKKYKVSPSESTTASSSKSKAPTTTKKSSSLSTQSGKELSEAEDIARESSPPDVVDEDESVETEPDDDEDEEETTGKGRKGKGKKPAAKAFQGTKSGFGTSIEAPDDATQEQPWKCANRDCNSGQTYHKRDGPHSYGRKVISNFFGRNKKETNLINLEVWHNYCRKCYQRSTYRVNNISSLEKVKFYINNIEMQLDRIELWRPNATFTVQLSKGAVARLGKYYRELNKQGATAASAQAAVTKAAQTNSKGKAKPLPLEDGFPIDLMAHFENHYVGTDQSFLDVKLILNWVTNLAENGQIDCMPPMEFLISKQANDEEGVIDPASNYDRWCAHEDGIEYEDQDDAEEEGYEAGDDDDATNSAGDYGRDGRQRASHYDQHAHDANDRTAEPSDESDEEIKDAIKFMSDQYIRSMAKDAAAAAAPTSALNKDFYEDYEQTDEDEQNDKNEQSDEPITPPARQSPPQPRPFQLTPTGSGGPILPNQASTYHVNRDGPSVDFSHKRKRSYQQEAIDARLQRPATASEQEAVATLLGLKSGRQDFTYKAPGLNGAATKSNIEPASSQRVLESYNDTSSEGGEEAPSKKRKL